MEIKYKFVNGEETSISVYGEFEKIILELDRNLYNNNHAETRRHVSLSVFDESKKVFTDIDTSFEEHKKVNMDVTWFLTAISLSGTLLNIRKNILCFYIWLIGDILWCTFDFAQGMYGRSLLDFIQIILAICGIVLWKKQKELIKPRL